MARSARPTQQQDQQQDQQQQHAAGADLLSALAQQLAQQSPGLAAALDAAWPPSATDDNSRRLRAAALWLAHHGGEHALSFVRRQAVELGAPPASITAFQALLQGDARFTLAGHVVSLDIARLPRLATKEGGGRGGGGGAGAGAGAARKAPPPQPRRQRRDAASSSNIGEDAGGDGGSSGGSGGDVVVVDLGAAIDAAWPQAAAAASSSGGGGGGEEAAEGDGEQLVLRAAARFLAAQPAHAHCAMAVAASVKQELGRPPAEVAGWPLQQLLAGSEWFGVAGVGNPTITLDAAGLVAAATQAAAAAAAAAEQQPQQPPRGRGGRKLSPEELLQQLPPPAGFVTGVDGDQHPVRPGRPDCQFFLRRSFCRHGVECIYNHRVSPAGSQGAEGGSAAAPAAAAGAANKPRQQQQKQEQQKQAPLKLGAAPPGVRYGPLSFGLKGRPSAPLTGLTPDDLPQRARAANCTFFGYTGRCSHGRACARHHPLVAALPARYVEDGKMSQAWPKGKPVPFARLVGHLARLWDDGYSDAAAVKLWLARHVVAAANPGRALWSPSAALPALVPPKQVAPGPYGCTLAEAEAVAATLWAERPRAPGERETPLPPLADVLLADPYWAVVPALRQEGSSGGGGGSGVGGDAWVALDVVGIANTLNW